MKRGCRKSPFPHKLTKLKVKPNMCNSDLHMMGESIIGPGRKQEEEVVHQALNL